MLFTISNTTKTKANQTNESLVTVTTQNIVLPTSFFSSIELSLPLNLITNHKRNRKTMKLLKSIAKNGFSTITSPPFINITYKNNTFRAIDGEHRLVLIEALDIPYFRCNLTVSYDDKNDISKYSAKKVLEKIDREKLTFLKPYDNDFTKDYIKMSLQALYEINKSKNSKSQLKIPTPFRFPFDISNS